MAASKLPPVELPLQSVPFPLGKSGNLQVAGLPLLANAPFLQSAADVNTEQGMPSSLKCLLL